MQPGTHRTLEGQAWTLHGYFNSARMCQSEMVAARRIWPC